MERIIKEFRSKISVDIHPLEWYRDNVPCRTACPVDTDSGQYVQLIAQGRYLDAFHVARSPNPLASVCGRICAAPCEDACRRGAIDSPVSIRALKRFVTEKYGSESQQPNTFRSMLEGDQSVSAQSPGHLGQFLLSDKKKSKKVAIIGSGPAGLGAAHDLALIGYPVTIFEASDEAGGMIRYGIPEYRLPRSVIAKEVSNILSLGVELKTRHPITKEHGISELLNDGFDAVFIAVGTQSGRALDIPGAELDGVIKAVDYLLNVNQGYKVDLGDKVLVIGGGSVALDAARTASRSFYAPDEAKELAAQAGDMHIAIDVARSAKREGSVEVHLASLESFDEMPAAKSKQGSEELEAAAEEGIRFFPSKGPKRIIGENGNVKGIELITVSSVFDDEGRFNPSYVEGSEEILEYDSIILAIGQAADTGFIKENEDIELLPSGTIKVDSDTLATSKHGVFAGGDVAFGPRIVIEGVENGKRAARSINEYLSEEKPEIITEVTIEKIPIDKFTMPAAYEKTERCHPPSISNDRRTGITEVEEVYSEEEAVRQAERCLECHVETVFDSDLCVLCGRCVDICPEECLALVPTEMIQIEGGNIPNWTENGNGNSAMLKDHERCIRCGLCAERCPTEAWTMERFNFQDVIQGGV